MSGVSTATVTLRSATDDDAAVLRSIRSEVIADRLAPIADPALIDMQLRAQQAGWMQSHPAARHYAIETEARTLGYAVVDESSTPWHLVDVAVARAERGRGVGAATLRALQERTAALTLQVWSGDAATIRLYERVGFVSLGDADHTSMRWERP
jgi:ribosomal protein S18 acetylase RimI-like enzyme